MPASRARLRVALFLAVGMAMTGFALVAYATNLMRGFENDSLDARFSIRGLQAAPDDVIVVDIDVKTFTDLNTRWERWPPDLPRRRHRPARRGRRPRDRLRRPVHRAERRPRRGQRADQGRRPRGLRRARDHRGRRGGAHERLRRRGGAARVQRPRAANAALPPDQGGVIRKIPFEVEKLETFAVAASEAALGHQLQPPKGGQEWIDFRGLPGTIDTVSFVNLVNKTLPASAFRGKVVVVGSSAPSLHDVHPTSDGARPADVRAGAPGERDLDRPPRLSAAVGARSGSCSC